MSLETELASELKKLCILTGNDDLDDASRVKEINLKATGNIFHKLGVLYMEKRHSKELVHVRFVQSAALLVAAKLRHPTEKAAGKDLEKLWHKVQAKAKAKYPNYCLSKISEHIKAKVNAMRQKTKKSLSIIPILKFSMPKWEVNLRQKNKIKIIEKLQNEIFTSYTEVMKIISETSIDILGTVPCKFALIGMGSLARKEITPYSDFECAILLEEGVQKQLNYENILDYFRWFAVIFQVIIISLGETILPSMAIPGLNGCKKGDNWFYDSITPRGISFDGFMPHACKTPLGRQELTDKKPWKTELIKPVSEMLEYLSVEEDLKNGYNLADVLTQTCFVFGDKTLFNNYRLRVNLELKKNLNSRSYQEMFRKQLEKDCNKFDCENTLKALFILLKANVKTTFYRNPTIFLSAAAKWLGYACASSFEIISTLKKNKQIDELMEHKLKYAVAIACELRLKVYEKKKKQEDSVKLFSTINKEYTPLVYDLIGRKCIFDFFKITWSLIYNFPFLQSEAELKYFIEEDTTENVEETCNCYSLLALVLREKRCISDLAKFLDKLKPNKCIHNIQTIFETWICLFFFYKNVAIAKLVNWLLSIHGVNTPSHPQTLHLSRHFYFINNDEISFEQYTNIYNLLCDCNDYKHTFLLRSNPDFFLQIPGISKPSPFSLESLFTDVVDVIEHNYLNRIDKGQDNDFSEKNVYLLSTLVDLLLSATNFCWAVQELRRELKSHWPHLRNTNKHCMMTRKRKAEENILLQHKIRKINYPGSSKLKTNNTLDSKTGHFAVS